LLLVVGTGQVCGLLLSEAVPVEHVGAMLVEEGSIIISVAGVIIGFIIVIVSVFGIGVVGRLKLASQLLVITWARSSKLI